MTEQKSQISAFKRVIIGSTLAIGLAIAAYVIYPSFFGATQSIPAPTKITGKIITLKKLTMDDALAFHAAFSDAVRDPLEFPPVITLAYTIHYLQDEVQKMHDGLMLKYGVYDNKDNTFIGVVEVREKNATDPGQLGCWINEKYWGGGRIQEALKLIHDAYFKLHPEADSYLIYVSNTNHRSYKAMLKFGCKDTGTTDRHYRVLIKKRS